ncbi:hypothetical protein [Flavivirga aquatica]|nr:hypothetical protein [Flavivirga aquatica]
MKIKNSKYYNILNLSKLQFSFGDIYLFDDFVVTEIYEGVHLDKDKIWKIMNTVVDFYGVNAKICYISNRINSYSSNPQEWVKALNTYDIVIAGAIVYYNLSSLMNANIENFICPKEVKQFQSLDESIKWVMRIKELNRN